MEKIIFSRANQHLKLRDLDPVLFPEARESLKALESVFKNLSIPADVLQMANEAFNHFVREYKKFELEYHGNESNNGRLKGALKANEPYIIKQGFVLPKSFEDFYLWFLFNSERWDGDNFPEIELKDFFDYSDFIISQSKKPKERNPTNDGKALFCKLLIEANVEVKEVSNEKYCQYICNKYGLSYHDNVRGKFSNKISGNAISNMRATIYPKQESRITKAIDTYLITQNVSTKAKTKKTK